MIGAEPKPLRGKQEILEFLGCGKKRLKAFLDAGAPIERTKRGHMLSEGWKLWDAYMKFEKNDNVKNPVKRV